jgi:hypothetical protein
MARQDILALHPTHDELGKNLVYQGQGEIQVCGYS